MGLSTDLAVDGFALFVIGGLALDPNVLESLRQAIQDSFRNRETFQDRDAKSHVKG